MQVPQNAIDASRQLLLEGADRVLGDLQSIGLEVAVAKQHLTEATDASPAESVQESINRASAELDRAEHDLRMVLATIVLTDPASFE